ncbi:MAG: hypothetical protein IKE65_01250 [Clostridia bacterium]|nr:hypothetical protein [Clostridia bacterium]
MKNPLQEVFKNVDKSDFSNCNYIMKSFAVQKMKSGKPDEIENKFSMKSNPPSAFADYITQ